MASLPSTTTTALMRTTGPEAEVVDLFVHLKARIAAERASRRRRVDAAISGVVERHRDLLTALAER